MELFGLKILNWLLAFLPTFTIDIVAPTLSSEVMNIFAWANCFLPIDMALEILAVYSVFYFFKVMLNLVMMFIPLLKK